MMRFFLGDPVFQHGMTVSIANILADYCAQFYLLDLFYSGIQLYVLLSIYLFFIS